MWSNRRIVFWVFMIFCVQATFAAVAPPGYVELSAREKRAWHQEQLLAGEYTPGGLFEPVAIGCAQLMGAQVGFSKRQLRKTLTESSGYPAEGSDWIRSTFGKGIHNRGPMAIGEWELLEPIMGLEPGIHPVSFRFSQANLFIRYLPGAEYRPGWVILIHRDGLPDMNLFMMPPNGLDGFSTERNPFSIKLYSHWLNRPGLVISALSAISFGRIIDDPFTQIVTDEPLRNYSANELHIPTRLNSKQITIHPTAPWENAYQSLRSENYRLRFSKLDVGNEHPAIFRSNVYDANSETWRPLGEFRILSRFINSTHSDRWMAQHQGFVLRD